MTSKEFIFWLDGFMDAVDGVPTQTQWDLIKNKLYNVGDPITLPISDPNPFPKIDPKPHPFTPYKPTPNPYTGGKEGKVMYSDICNCNPKNGGNGICGCVIAHELVDPNIKQGIASTGTIVTSGNTSYTIKKPDNITLSYTTNSSKELLKD